MKPRILSLSVVLAIAGLASPFASAQFTSSKISPTTTIKLSSTPKPSLAVLSTTHTPGADLQLLEFQVSGLFGASEAHIERVDMGNCPFAVDTRVTGNTLFLDEITQVSSDGRKALTSNRAPQSDDPPGVGKGFAGTGVPTSPGRPVDSAGVVKFKTSGVAGATQRFRVPGPVGSRHIPVVDPDANQIVCNPTAMIFWKDKASGEWRTMDSKSQIVPARTSVNNGDVKRFTSTEPYVLQRGALKKFTNTSAFTDFKSLPGTGICAGMSIGPKSYPVGIQKKDGDLTFTIRSGPEGTRCSYFMPPQGVAGGILFDKANWTVTREGTACHVGQQSKLLLESLVPDFFNAFSVFLERSTLFERIVQEPDGTDFNLANFGFFGDPEILGPVPTSQQNFRRQFPGMMVTLECKPTVVNDNSITLRFDDVTYYARNGQTFVP